MMMYALYVAIQDGSSMKKTDIHIAENVNVVSGRG